MDPSGPGGDEKQSIVSYIKKDCLSYFKEFTCTSSKPNPEILAAIRTAVETNKIVIFTKPGCGFCKRAKALFSTHYCQDVPFVEINGSTKEYRKALSVVVGAPIISFPMCYVNGVYLGGSDDAYRLHYENKLLSVLEDERVPMSDFGHGMIKTKPSYFTKLAGSEGGSLENRGPCDSSTSKWYFFQMKSYAQVIRMMSFIHAIILLIMLGCGESNTLIGTTIGVVMAAILCVDLTLYVCFGATPLTLVGNFSTKLVWNFKGDAVPSIPYKVVFVVYIIVLARLLITCNNEYENALICWTNNTVEYRAELISGVVNSGSLAIFRF
jgi:glutaredoxin 3